MHGKGLERSVNQRITFDGAGWMRASPLVDRFGWIGEVG
jgi:hypothetical protein